MKTLYLELGMGAAGDMLAAALIELLPDPEAFIGELNGLGIPGVVFEKEASVKCGITGTRIKVTVGGDEEESLDCGHGHDVHPHTHDNTGYVHEEGSDPAHDHAHTYDSHEHRHDGHGHTHAHRHSSLADIEHIVRGHLSIPERVADDVMAVYALIAEAESHAHGQPVEQIHFHEVGTLDAIADITAVCLLMSRIAPDEVTASPVHVGCGSVRCAHGILPVPAPATEYILRNVPIYGGSIIGELCTPTGAALLKHFVTRFGEMPVMRVERTGCGMGRKDFAQANCVRAFLGESLGRSAGGIAGRSADNILSCGGAAVSGRSAETGGHSQGTVETQPLIPEESGAGSGDISGSFYIRGESGTEGILDAAQGTGTRGRMDTVCELSCNLDDMSPEAVGFAMEALFAGGALDVYTVPVGMKKSRPGTLLSVMCREEDREKIISIIFRNTSTIGVRENVMRRYILSRETTVHETEYGPVREKISRGYGVVRHKYEYDDLAGIAAKRGMTLKEAAEMVRKTVRR